MAELHLRPGFSDKTCGPFTKNKERIKQLKKRHRRLKIHLSKRIR